MHCAAPGTCVSGRPGHHMTPVGWVCWMIPIAGRGENAQKRLKAPDSLYTCFHPWDRKPFPPSQQVTHFRNSCWEGSEISPQAHKRWQGLSQALERAKLEERIWLTNQWQRTRTLQVYQVGIQFYQAGFSFQVDNPRLTSASKCPWF